MTAKAITVPTSAERARARPINVRNPLLFTPAPVACPAAILHGDRNVSPESSSFTPRHL
jgi:hypothetical protein